MRKPGSGALGAVARVRDRSPTGNCAGLPLGGSAIGSPYSQSISLGLECASFLAGHIANLHALLALRMLLCVRSADIQTLFGYLYWVRDRVLVAAGEAALSADLRAALVHELDVETGWRARLTGAEERDLDPADFQAFDTLTTLWRRDEVEMRRWLAMLTDAALAAPPPLEKDQSFPLWYYLVHIVSHGIQELEEAVVLLGQSGHSPRNLGFLDYADTIVAEDVSSAGS